jgi:hypothetical protein
MDEAERALDSKENWCKNSRILTISHFTGDPGVHGTDAATEIEPEKKRQGCRKEVSHLRVKAGILLSVPDRGV